MKQDGATQNHLKEEIENIPKNSFAAIQNNQQEVLAIILQKLQILEEKIDRIENQTKTHWAQ
ncbi:hypothetical protein ACFSQD_13905 [Flavihumibacter stibioxidans]|uniref:Uncharacterized protein n=1 Tax=Flavihumibacter stibioxidans TaxID=1834163 RepID=A0ABR7M9N8_9BACT|nr:hypothetical protein [Flavihumibacter stibioxidans]MBC6491303.1 hypothetical protein [Flavihumibacter stibioxidans]